MVEEAIEEGPAIRRPLYDKNWRFKKNMPMPESHTAPALSRLCGIFYENDENKDVGKYFLGG